MADYARPTGPIESEPVLVDHDGQHVTLTLEDGSTITLDERELLSTLRAA
jgi:hypothetical protein